MKKFLVRDLNELRDAHNELWKSEPSYGDYLFEEMLKPEEFPCVAVNMSHSYTYVYLTDFKLEYV